MVVINQNGSKSTKIVVTNIVGKFLTKIVVIDQNGRKNFSDQNCSKFFCFLFGHIETPFDGHIDPLYNGNIEPLYNGHI